MNNLELKVIFAAVDKFVRPVKQITGAASEAAKALRDNNARMKELNRTVEQIDAFKKIEADAEITANTFAKTKRQIEALTLAIGKAGVPTKKQADELAKLSKESDDLRKKHQSLATEEQKLFEKLKQSGVNTEKLAEERMRLASASAQATNASRRLQDNLEAENKKMRELRAAQADLTKARESAGKLAMTGAGITAAGAAMSAPLALTIKQYADFETAMLGVAKQVEGARDENGRLTATYHEMAEAIKAMSERLPMPAKELAAIVEGAARMGVQGKENLLIFAEQSAIMAEAFEISADKIGMDMGRIADLYGVPIQRIAELGDSINWLDDGMTATGEGIIDVMQRVAGIATTVGMSYKETAALATAFLSTGANAEVAASATQAMIRELSVANMQSKRFKEGARMLGLEVGALQKSASTAPLETIIKVMEALKSLPQDKRIEAATRLFGKEYGDDASKLSQNMDKLHEAMRLVNDERARGSMLRESESRNRTLGAKGTMLSNALENLGTDVGGLNAESAKESADWIKDAVQQTRDWIKENPKLASGLASAFKVIAYGAGVIGGALVGLSGVMVALASIKFALAKTAIAFPWFGRLLAGIGGMAKWLGGVFMGAGKLMVKAILLVGRALFMTPIGLIVAGIAAIATAAYLIYTNWEPIKQFFSDLWGSISTAAKLAWDELKAWFSSLPESFKTIGTAIVDGIASGMRAGWTHLKTLLKDLASDLPEPVRRALGIHSPSRVFAELGRFTMAGLEKGISDNEDGPLKSLGDVSRRIAAAGAVALVPQLSAAGPLQQRPHAAQAGGNTYHITIQAAPGASMQDLADLVVQAIERHDARKAAAKRSRFVDPE